MTTVWDVGIAKYSINRKIDNGIISLKLFSSHEAAVDFAHDFAEKSKGKDTDILHSHHGESIRMGFVVEKFKLVTDNEISMQIWVIERSLD